MDYEPDVPTDSYRPEVLVPRLVELVELHARVRWIDLEIEGRGLGGLLLVAHQPGEARCKRVGDSELHHSTLNTFMTSSPRWLITLTAIRPPSGLSKGRDVSLFSVAHASSLISDLRVFLRLL